jgi:Uma2 family endonuclease
MRNIRIPEAQNLVLDGEPWSFYSRLLRHFDRRRRLFITYYRGFLEITTRTFWRERAAVIMAMLVQVWTEERELPIRSGGSTRLGRRDLGCGLEPNECFWLSHEAQMRGVKELDLRRHPLPDLVIEVDPKWQGIPRLPIYAALGVPEVWRVSKAGVLSFHVLQPDEKYAVVSVSAALPPLTSADIQPHLDLRDQIDDNAVVRGFRAWVRTLPPPTP